MVSSLMGLSGSEAGNILNTTLMVPFEYSKIIIIIILRFLTINSVLNLAFILTILNYYYYSTITKIANYITTIVRMKCVLPLVPMA